MAYATPDDVATFLGRELTEAETAIVQGRLEYVEDVILSRIPDLAARIGETPRLGRLLTMIEVDAILRLIKNPEGYTAETDGNYSYQIDGRVASGRISLLPEEWQLLGVRTALFVLSPKISLGRREEGEVDPYKGKSGPETRPFEQGFDEAVWG
jgi:hypothetical protein